MIQKEVDRLANGKCEYCHCLQKYTPEKHEFEHIIPIIQGGKSVTLNLARACRGCKNLKSISIAGIDPETQEITPLFNPRKDRWHEHFSWSNDKILLIGRTPKGRATINRLKLNRKELKNIRRITIDFGHPPPLGS